MKNFKIFFLLILFSSNARAGNCFEKLPKDILFLIFNFSIFSNELIESEIFKSFEQLRLLNKNFKQLTLEYIKLKHLSFNYINFKANLIYDILKSKTNNLNFLQKIDITGTNSGFLLYAIELEATNWILFYRKSLNLENSLSNIMTKLVLYICSKNYCVDDIFNKYLDKIILVMINSGFDVNFQDFNYKNSFLNIATKANNLNLIKFLVEKKADINCKNTLGETSLFSAAKNNNYDIVCFLLANGADPETKDTNGQLSVGAQCCQLKEITC